MSERPTFDLQVNPTDTCPVFKLQGRLMDQQQADRLLATLDDGLAGGQHSVVLDMSELQYMNSTGLNILINVLTRTRNAGGDAIISGLSPSVRQLFVVTKLDSVFTITGGVDEALAKVKA
ncbi:MAG: STAS domain-containing protein [Flavobacteriales bacterium]|nr:putative anti-sigma factor antagonist [Flavobacteriales bacterium]MCC6576483.1 STAS domain-containing protein [Flavobacteriales bacterium]NUQ16515.1 STAS domain-containing protein [Flavobacteriales bacterium]